MQHDAAESCELPGQMQTLAMAVHEAHPFTLILNVPCSLNSKTWGSFYCHGGNNIEGRNCPPIKSNPFTKHINLSSQKSPVEKSAINNDPSRQGVEWRSANSAKTDGHPLRCAWTAVYLLWCSYKSTAEPFDRFVPSPPCRSWLTLQPEKSIPKRFDALNLSPPLDAGLTDGTSFRTQYTNYVAVDDEYLALWLTHKKQNRSKPLAKYTEHVAKHWISKLSPNIKFEVLFRKTEISNFKIDPIPF
jgi:hypothetical protein